MTRYVLTLNLKDDPRTIETYRRHHARVWPEVLQSLRDAGVERMDIHLLGRQLVMYLELADDLDFRRVFAEHAASSPRVAEWERLMKSLQEPSPLAPAGDWWTVMEPVFRLDDREPAIARVVERSATS
ncbi:MAG: L-rhamnose mutarotase [Vicinamibacterales bacterium]|nr:L-rhamnose mutarotase [Vicinamibacterales bacterium]